MILVLGASGYIGQAFIEELRRRGEKALGLSRKEADYAQFADLRNFLGKTKPDFLINAAGFTGVPNVDACEEHRAETLQGNLLLPQLIGSVCAELEIPWGHVSSGCIYNGAKVLQNGTIIFRDLNSPDFRKIFDQYPETVRGFAENDPPNFSFRSPPCSFYSGTKAMAEEALQQFPNVYLWRLRMPFDEVDHPRNLLTKLMKYERVYDNVNSLSHRGDFVRACLDLWKIKAAPGIYNITNPGFLSTRQLIARIQPLCPNKQFQFFENDAEFYSAGVKAPRSNCLMDISKLEEAGVHMRDVDAALAAVVRNWRAS